MRLSHWDFRPKQRRRFVASGTFDGRPGSRRKPALRILLLLSLGLLVYFKYDDVVQSGWVDRLREPGELWKEAMALLPGSGKAAAPSASPVYSPDSTAQEWTCAAPAQDSCLAAWTALPAADRGALRALILKARLKLGLPPPSGFHALFLRTPAADPGAAAVTPWKLGRLILETGNRTVTLSPVSDPGGTWCSQDDPGSASGACLAAPLPSPPLAGRSERVASRPPEAAFPGPAGRAFGPILPGRIVEWPAGAGWIKIHHGGSLYSYYSGVASPAPGVAVGSRVEPGVALGFTAGLDSASAAAQPASGEGLLAAGVPSRDRGEALRLRIEKDGSPIDPSAFLGWDEAADSSSVAHGP